MTNAPVSPTRRAVLRTIATIVALAALAVLAGCGTSTKPTPGATAGGVVPSMIIRHGEKPDDTNPGVNAYANQDDTSLTEIARWTLITYLTLALCVLTWAAARPAQPAGPGSAAVLAGRGTSTEPTPGATAGGVAPSTRPTPGVATAGGVAPSTLVMIIRHGEKPDDTKPGVDANRNRDNTSSTEIGGNRAYRVVDLVDPAQGPPRPGLARPTAIYAAGANDDGEGARTRDTVAALADKHGIPVNTSFGRSDEKALVRHVISGQGPTLISWQHDGIPTIAAAFPSVTPTPPSEWPDGRFDVVWTFTKTVDGWHFAQMPERALPQDQAGVIEH